ncbi:MAG: Glu/Leu/Phe/Val dehydrogenase, partial [Actinobacteria bacterium]|nr:Glu/Leu/Phe/Val dehydrogenase [Actinomycetota bacterium]
CFLSDAGLDVDGLLRTRPGGSIVRSSVVAAPREAIFEQSADVLLLVAYEDGMSRARAAGLDPRAVVLGANLGLSPDCEELLHRRGVLVIPDVVGLCGDSASMDALFGPPACPGGRVLDHVGMRMRELVTQIRAIAHPHNSTPRQVARTPCNARAGTGARLLYGAWVPQRLPVATESLR